MAANPLGQRLNDHGRAVLRRAVQVGRGEGVVHEDGHGAGQGVGRLHNGGHVGHVYQRVSDGLNVPELGLGRGGRHKGVNVVVLHEGGLDAQVAQGVQEDVPGAAVQGVGGHDLVPGAHQVGDGQDLRRVTGGDCDCASRALNGGDARGHGVRGGVGQAAVDVARAAEGELGSAVLGVLELEGRGGVDGQRGGAGGWVGRQAGVDLQGVKVLLDVGCECGVEFERHDVPLSVEFPYGALRGARGVFALGGYAW